MIYSLCYNGAHNASEKLTKRKQNYSYKSNSVVYCFKVQRALSFAMNNNFQIEINYKVEQLW